MVKSPPANAGDAGGAGSIPGSGRSPGEGYGNPLQCSCLGSPTDRGAWWATAQSHKESDMTEHAHTHTHTPRTHTHHTRVRGGDHLLRVLLLMCLWGMQNSA